MDFWVTWAGRLQMDRDALCSRYWGKAATAGSPPYHLFALHSLDVTAVADCWLSRDSSLLASLARASQAGESELRAWLLFFIALHDLGKLDARFQLKAPAAARQLNRICTPDNAIVPQRFDHGTAGYSWFVAEKDSHGMADDSTLRWVQAAAGHHGRSVHWSDPRIPADPKVMEHDKLARAEWIAAAGELFLKPAGIEFASAPPGLPSMFAESVLCFSNPRGKKQTVIRDGCTGTRDQLCQCAGE